MVIVAGVFTSVESKQIDTWYSRLIDSDIKAVQELDAARALTVRYGLYLYKLIVEPNSDRRNAINLELESTHDEYKACTADAARLYPALGKQIAATTATFEKAVLDSLPVRRAALANENQKAAELMRSGVDDELERARIEASENFRSNAKRRGPAF